MNEVALNPDKPVTRRIRSALGRAGREALLHAEGQFYRGQPTVVFLASDVAQYSNLLRVFLVAKGLRARGWRAIVVPKHLSLRQRQRVLARLKPDILFVKGARHPLNRAGDLDEHPFVVDLDDADFLDPRLSEPMADLAAGAVGFIAGSRFVADWARQYCRNTVTIWTGSPVTEGNRPPQADREPIVAWAQSSPLRYRSEKDFVTDVLARVAKRRKGTRLRLYGRSPGQGLDELGALSELDLEIEWLGRLPYRDFLTSLREVAIGLSPVIPESAFSRGKSFGKILGYLDAKVPVICSDEADHSLFFDDGMAIVSNDPDVWSDGILRLLDSADTRQDMADRSFDAYLHQLSLDAATNKVERFLRDCLERLPQVGGSRDAGTT